MNTNEESPDVPRSNAVKDQFPEDDIFFECYSPTRFAELFNQPEPGQDSEHGQPENKSHVYSGEPQQAAGPHQHRQGPNHQEPLLRRPAHEQINNLQHKLENLTSKLQKMSCKLTQEKERNNALEEDLSKYKRQLQDLKDRMMTEYRQKIKYKGKFIRSECRFRKMRESLYQLWEETETLKKDLKKKTATNSKLSSQLTSQERIIKNLKKKEGETLYNTIFCQPTDSEASTSKQKSSLHELDTFKGESQQLADEHKRDDIPESQQGVSEVPDVKEEEASESMEQEKKMDPEYVEESKPEPTSERVLECVLEGLTEQTVEPQPDTASTKEQEPTPELIEVAQQPEVSSESRKYKQKTEHLMQTEQLEEQAKEEEKPEDPKEVEASELINQGNEVEEEPQTTEGAIEDRPRAEADGERVSDNYFTASLSSTSLEVPDSPDAEERVSLWRRFKKFMTPKHLRQYKDRR